MANGWRQEIRFRLALSDDSDVTQARVRLRQLGVQHGFAHSSIEALATAASEVGRNAIVHAVGGELLIGTVHRTQLPGLVVIARDTGPGISNMEAALTDGYSTAASLGLGLPSARRLVDEFHIDSRVGSGTTITLVVWLRQAAAAPR